MPLLLTTILSDTNTLGNAQIVVSPAGFHGAGRDQRLATIVASDTAAVNIAKNSV